MNKKCYSVLFDCSNGIQWETSIYAKSITHAMKQAIYEFSQERKAGTLTVSLADFRTREDELEVLTKQLDDQGNVLS